MDSPSQITRRKVLGGAAAGLTLPVLTACGGGTGDSDTSRGPRTGTPTPDPSTDPGASATPSGNAADSLVATADVPEGGGVILDDVVVTQPTKGEFKAFSATCTHQQCKVSGIDSSIHCSCHGSQFSIVDGSVENGPATSGLPEEAIKLSGNDIVRS